MEPLLNIAMKAARKAGEIMLHHRNQLDTITVTEKSKNDFVSEVDIKVERAIIDIIHRAHPDHGILAEESGLTEGSDEVTWLIDPIDGTSNYIHGFPHYAVSIGIKVKNKIEYGLIYDPSRQEFFTAKRGGGARLNNRRIRVAKLNELDNALLGTGYATRNPDVAQTQLSIIQSLLHECGGFRRAGSATLDLAYVASGRLDGFWEFGLRPWDLAAGTLMIREAGGLVGDFSGSENYLETGEIISGNPKIFKELLRKLQPLVKPA